MLPGDPPGPSPARRFSRRQLLRGTALGIGGAAAATAGLTSGGATPKGSGRGSGSKGAPVHSDVVMTSIASGVTVPVAGWLVDENARTGTVAWIVTGTQTPHAIEGFASHVSAVRGEDVTVFVNTSARSVTLEAYRMGYYQGLGGRLIWTSAAAPGVAQPAPVIDPVVNTVHCPWSPTFTVRVDHSWPPGCYLLKLVGTGGQQQYVPLTVRDDDSTAAFVFQNSVTTWQAYNLWGGYSLYYGRRTTGGQDFTHRARIVSFDRPYPQTWAQGSADFFGNEFPVLFHAERLGLDMTYWTDVDLNIRPTLLVNHRCLLSLGHDEYWSNSMRVAALDALAKGTNFCFLGANACYRQIRMQASPTTGRYRYEVCYKDAAADPLHGVDTALVTSPSWISAPTTWPESNLIGSMYQSVRATDPLVLTDASHWILDGCGFTDGQQLPAVVQGEYDRYVPGLAGPRNLDILAHSPVVGQTNWSDMTYYTAPNGGGGVFAAGVASFVFKLSNSSLFPDIIVPAAIPGVTLPLLRLMENLYSCFGAGPASLTRPSTGTWQSVYTGSAGTAPTAPATPAA